MEVPILFKSQDFSLNEYKANINDQGKKLMQMIGTAVNGLDKFDSIVPALQELGKRHVGYGVNDEHYDTVGSALLWTLDQGLGDAFTQEVAEAWTTVYTVLATTMKDAAATVDVTLNSSTESNKKWSDVRNWFQKTV
jgi:hemoglobin-like flavoprotein